MGSIGGIGGIGNNDLQSLSGMFLTDTSDVEKLRKRYMVDNDTGYSLFEVVDDDGLRFGIGSINTIFQILAFAGLLVYAAFADWSGTLQIANMQVAQSVFFVFLIIVFVILQVPCFIIAEKTKAKHLGAFISHDFTYTAIIGIVALILMYLVFF